MDAGGTSKPGERMLSIEIGLSRYRSAKDPGFLALFPSGPPFGNPIFQEKENKLYPPFSNANHSMPSKVVSILGMHRSGTSCLSGMLENAGLNLGNVSRQNPHNKRGNNENPKIMALHEAMLAANKSSWNRPPAAGCHWNPQHLDELRKLVEEYSPLEIWGFKDPRTLFTLEGWLEVIPQMRFVGSFRHPVAVARSLVARGGGMLSTHLELWWLYNCRLLRFHDRFGFDLICFDELSEGYKDRVSEAAKNLGLNPVQSAMTFFESELRSQQAGEIPLPSHVRGLYHELLERSLACRKLTENN